MLSNYIDIILYLTGGLTAFVVVQLFIPVPYIKFFNKIELEDSDAIFFARLWALMVGTLGALILWAGYDETIRIPVLTISAISKAIFVIVLLLNFKKQGKGFMTPIILDSVSAILYAAYLFGL